MSRLAQLAGKGKKFKIGGIELEIKPLTVSDMDLMTRLGKEDATAMKELIAKVLKDSVPDATDDEVDKMSVEHVTKLMEAIMEVNNLEMDKSKQNFLEEIKKKQKV